MNILKKTNIFGFTLIEAIIAISIIGVIGLVLSDLLSKGFKGSNKTQIIGNVKQNGQVAMNLMDQTIRKAEVVICPLPPDPPPAPPPPPSPIIVVQDKNGNYTRYVIKAEDTMVPLASRQNGYITSDDPTKATLQTYLSCSTNVFDPNCAQYLCDPLGSYAPLPNPTLTSTTFLTTYNDISGVSVKDGGFIRQLSTTGSKDSILIKFTLGSAVHSGYDYSTQLQTNVAFETAVQLR